MDIFSVFTIAGGLAFFLYGMHVLSSGLEKLAGGRLEQTLRGVTASTARALALGAGITIAIQSSSAMTVMLVGLVNSGIMQLSQTVGLIMGSNIGTTLTAWILSLAGIETSNIFVRMFSPEAFSPIMAFVGIVMMIAAKKKHRRDIGELMVGFAVLMYGMELMKNAVAPLADSPDFYNIITYFKNPLLGVLTGTVVTAVIQSSAASVGILQALSLTGGISYGMAIPIIMGQNIGTCATAIISSIGANKNAKRVAAVHIYFNMIGTLVLLAALYGFNALFPIAFLENAIDPVGIAACHTVFNVSVTALLLPFKNKLVKLAELTVRDKPGELGADGECILDERLLNTPSIAIAESKNAADRMAKLVKKTLTLSVKSLYEYDPDAAEKLRGYADVVDEYEDKLGSFLIKVRGDLSDADRKTVSQLLRAIGDIERIGDHSENILGMASELHEKKLRFSHEAEGELEVIENALEEIMDITVGAFVSGDSALAARVEPLEQVIDGLKDEILARHVERLQRGVCTIELGFILSNLLTDYERISDHCSNLAASVIKTDNSALLMDIHEYLHGVRSGEVDRFNEEYDEYEQKYKLRLTESV